MKTLDLWQKERQEAKVIEFGLRVMVTERFGKFHLRIWKPKAVKPHINYLFRTLEEVDKYIASQVESFRSWSEMIAKRKADREGTAEQLAAVRPGMIFHCSWGYEQTQCDFYQVVRVVGHHAIIRKIGSYSPDNHNGSQPMAEYRLATKDAFIGPEIRKRIQFSGGEPYLSMTSYSSANLWDGKPKYCSWYH